MQHQPGMRAVVTNYQRFELYRRVLTQLAQRGELTERRRRAVAPTLWRLAHWVGATHRDEAIAIADWVHQLVPGFVSPDRGAVEALYSLVGFRTGQRILHIRRAVVAQFRRTPRARSSSLPV
jgi:hypothetical protein